MMEVVAPSIQIRLQGINRFIESFPKSRSEELIQHGVPNAKCNGLLFLAFGANQVLKMVF
jgi:hypothetical protein